jgi:hypothetical protein
MSGGKSDKPVPVEGRAWCPAAAVAGRARDVLHVVKLLSCPGVGSSSLLSSTSPQALCLGVGLSFLVREESQKRPACCPRESRQNKERAKPSLLLILSTASEASLSRSTSVSPETPEERANKEKENKHHVGPCALALSVSVSVSLLGCTLPPGKQKQTEWRQTVQHQERVQEGREREAVQAGYLSKVFICFSGVFFS